MYVCMCVCVYVCMYACMHACMHACIHTRRHIQTYTCTHVQTHTHMHTYKHAYVHTYRPTYITQHTTTEHICIYVWMDVLYLLALCRTPRRQSFPPRSGREQPLTLAVCNTCRGSALFTRARGLPSSLVLTQPPTRNLTWARWWSLWQSCA